jgi:hypothetical protein
MNNGLNDLSIATLDLEPIKTKLMHRKSGQGWTNKRVEAVESEYRRFLYLVKKFPQQRVAPRFEVDLFWHQHILDTRKYAIDCAHIFGYFLHHYPYLGLRGEEDMTAREEAGQLMRSLYEEEFGESYDAPLTAAPEDRMSAKTAFGTLMREPAFCTVTAEPAFCTLSAETAFCTLSAEPAFCTDAAEAAFCTVTGTPQRKATTGKSASLQWSTHAGTAEPAFCTLEQASSMSEANVAFCTHSSVAMPPGVSSKVRAGRAEYRHSRQA